MRTTKVMFLDDSERSEDNSVAVGGLILDNDRMQELFVNVARWKTAHGIPDDAELKWSPQRNSWICHNLKRSQRIEFYLELLTLVRGIGGVAMVAVVDRSTLRWTTFVAKLRCIEWLTERFHLHLQEPAVDGCGIIVIDHFPSRREDKELQDAFDAWCRRGTQYVQPSRVVMNAMLVPSHLNVGIQLADLVAGATAQVFCHSPRSLTHPSPQSLTHPGQGDCTHRQVMASIPPLVR